MPNQNLISNTITHRKKHCLAALALLFLTTVSSADEEPGVVIEFASITLQDDTYLLDAQINYHLSEQAIEAINNGVTLTFNVDFSVAKPRKWMWNEKLFTVSFPYQLKYHTLAETYQVINLTTHLQHNFSSLEAALSSLGSLTEMPLHALPTQQDFNPECTLKAYLQIKSLPLPMRPLAYITPGWYLRSDLYQWHINP